MKLKSWSTLNNSSYKTSGPKQKFNDLALQYCIKYWHWRWNDPAASCRNATRQGCSQQHCTEKQLGLAAELPFQALQCHSGTVMALTEVLLRKYGSCSVSEEREDWICIQSKSDGNNHFTWCRTVHTLVSTNGEISQLPCITIHPYIKNSMLLLHQWQLYLLIYSQNLLSSSDLENARTATLHSKS